HPGLSASRVVCFLSGAVGLQRSLGAESVVAFRPWGGEDSKRGLGILPGPGDPASVRWHGGGGRPRALGGAARSGAKADGAMAAAGGEGHRLVALPKTSAWSQEEAAGQSIPQRRSRVDRQTNQAAPATLKGLG